MIKTEIEPGEKSYLFTFKPEDESSVSDLTEKKKALELSHANAALKEEIAQRKLAEATTRKTLSLLNAALESTADGILVVDNRGKITGYNRKYVNMWHIPDSVMESKKRSTVIEHIKTELKDPEGYMARVNELAETSGT